MGKSSIRSGFIPELNGLRAIAILMVFAHHVSSHVIGSHPLIAVVRRYVWLGWTGVDLFFVLSGFLITGLLLESREASNYFSGFYARRVLRIFPLYYTVLTVILVGAALLHSPSVSAVLPVRGDRWLYYSYLANWIGLWKAHWAPSYVNYLGHFWSLAVEEQFYLVWPLLIWLVPRSAIGWVAGSLTVLAAVIRMEWIARTGPQQAIDFATICRMDSLFVGALCALAFRSPLLSVWRRWLPAIAVTMIGTFLVLHGRLAGLLKTATNPDFALKLATAEMAQRGGYTLLALGFGAMVLYAASAGERAGPWMRGLRSRRLQEIGRYSYGIYVFHVPLLGVLDMFVVPWVLARVTSPTLLGLLAIAWLWSVTFLISALSYELFESRILKWKRYFEARGAEPELARTAGVSG